VGSYLASWSLSESNTCTRIDNVALGTHCISLLLPVGEKVA
jgi:hypothetical protein